MSSYPAILIDAGPMVALYNASDRHHRCVCEFFSRCTSRILTTPWCVSEALWVLATDWQVQNELLADLSNGIYECVPMTQEDFAHIAELNRKFPNAAADMADLSLIAVSERMGIHAIAALDHDLEIYRRYRRAPIEAVMQAS